MAQFFELTGDFDRASTIWKTLYRRRLKNWGISGAVTFLQRNHEFDAALEIFENAEFTPLCRLAASTILLEFPERRRFVSLDEKLVEETPEAIRNHAILALYVWGELDAAETPAGTCCPGVLCGMRTGCVISQVSVVHMST